MLRPLGCSRSLGWLCVVSSFPQPVCSHVFDLLRAAHVFSLRFGVRRHALDASRHTDIIAVGQRLVAEFAFDAHCLRRLTQSSKSLSLTSAGSLSQRWTYSRGGVV